MPDELENSSIIELLQQYVRVLKELRRRGIIRTNNLTGEYGEWLVANKLGLQLVGKSTRGYDAVDESGVRYEIKSRRITPENPSTQLGSIRELNRQGFHFLIAVLFDEDFSIRRVVKIPHAAIADYSRFVERTNSQRLLAQGKLLKDPRVEDITGRFFD